MSKGSLVGRDVCFTVSAASFYSTTSVDVFHVFDVRRCNGVYEYTGAQRDETGAYIHGSVRMFTREDVRIVGE